VSRCVVFWKGTERWANWGEHRHTQEENYWGIFSLASL